MPVGIDVAFVWNVDRSGNMARNRIDWFDFPTEPFGIPGVHHSGAGAAHEVDQLIGGNPRIRARRIRNVVLLAFG